MSIMRQKKLVLTKHDFLVFSHQLFEIFDIKRKNKFCVRVGVSTVAACGRNPNFENQCAMEISNPGNHTCQISILGSRSPELTRSVIAVSPKSLNVTISEDQLNPMPSEDLHQMSVISDLDCVVEAAVQTTIHGLA
jgi:hypothetical protein